MDLEIEALKSSKVFKLKFTDGKNTFQFRIGSSDQYVRILRNGEQLFERELNMGWAPKSSSIMVSTPDGQLSIHYASIGNNFIELSGQINKTLNVIL